jgi:hypothetical protein
VFMPAMNLVLNIPVYFPRPGLLIFIGAIWSGLLRSRQFQVEPLPKGWRTLAPVVEALCVFLRPSFDRDVEQMYRLPVRLPLVRCGLCPNGHGNTNVVIITLLAGLQVMKSGFQRILLSKILLFNIHPYNAIIRMKLLRLWLLPCQVCIYVMTINRIPMHGLVSSVSAIVGFPRVHLI